MEPVAGGCVRKPEAALEKLPGKKEAGGRGTWPGAWWDGCAGSTWCIQQIRLGCFTAGVRQSKGSEKLQPNPDKTEKSLLISRFICVFHHLMFSHLYQSYAEVVLANYHSSLLCLWLSQLPSVTQHIMHQLKYLAKISLPSGNWN